MKPNHGPTRRSSIRVFLMLCLVYGALPKSMGSAAPMLPLLGSEFTMDAPLIVTRPADQRSPAAASNGTNYLVLWQDTASGNDHIRVARVTESGVLVDTNGIRISSGATRQFSGAVASDGTNYFVVWSDDRTTNDFHIYGARVSAAGVVLDPQSIAITSPPGRQISPAVAWNGSHYLVVWDHYGDDGLSADIYGARVSATGVLLDTISIAINTATHLQRHPAVASDGTNFLVVWHHSTVFGGSADIFGCRVTGSGTVLDGAGMAISTVTNDQHFASVACNGSQYLVVWQDQRNGSFADVYGARVNAAGTVLDAAGLAISTASNHQSSASVVWGATNYFVVWQDSRNGAHVYGTRVNESGIVLDTLGIAIATNKVHRIPAITFNGATYLALWEHLENFASKTRIDASRLNQSGMPLDRFIIAIGTAVNQQEQPAAAWDGANFLVVWQDTRGGTNYDIYGVRVNHSGVVLDNPAIAISAATNDQVNPTVAFNGSHYFVIWQDRRSGSNSVIYGTRVSPEGVVLDSDGIAISPTIREHAFPGLCAGDADFLVVWEDARPGGLVIADLYGARVNGAGSVLDPGGFAVAVQGNAQQRPALAWNGSTYLVVWQDSRRFSGYFDIYGTRITANGQVLDRGGFAITTALLFERLPSVASDGTNYLVVWEDNSTRNGHLNIYGSRISAAGEVLEPEGFALSPAALLQFNPSIAWNGRNYLVAWEDIWRDAVQAAKVNAAAEILDPADFSLFSGSISNRAPAVVAGSPLGFLVVEQWVDTFLEARRVKGRFLIQNTAPVAYNQTIVAPRDTATMIRLNGNDPEGATLSYILTSLSAHGTLSGTPPDLIYTPSTSFSGIDTFTFKVSDGYFESSDASVTVNVSAVQITAHPQSQTSGSGDSITLSVEANGTAPLTYQWQINGLNIAGATNATFTLTNFSLAEVGRYTVTVGQNASTSITSAAATLSFLGLDMYAGLTLGGPVGSRYQVDYAEVVGGATNWITLTNLVLPASPFLLIDLEPAALPQRFYRAILVP